MFDDKGIRLTMRLYKPAAKQRQPKRRSQAHKNRLRIIPHGSAINAIENCRANDPRKRVQQASGAQ
jgi:hypothetical protein